VGPRLGRYDEVLVTSACSIWLSLLDDTATGARPGSGMLPLLLDVTAVVLTMSGQSAIPRGPGTVAGASFRVVAFLTGCFADFGFEQQLCAADVSQLSPSTTIVLDSSISAPITCILLQPKRHPPAIHTETVKARRTRGILMNRADFTSSSLLLKTQKYKDLASVM
jgi:hypothetical protein